MIVAFVIVAASLTASAQQKGRPWTPLRTAWGDPDIQGTWTNETITPFQKAADLSGEQAVPHRD